MWNESTTTCRCADEDIEGIKMGEKIITGGYFNPHNKKLADSFKESYGGNLDNGVEFSESVLLSQIEKRNVGLYRINSSVYDFLKSNRNMAYTVREISKRVKLGHDKVKQALVNLLIDGPTIPYIRLAEVTVQTIPDIPTLSSYYTVKFYYYKEPCQQEIRDWNKKMTPYNVNTSEPVRLRLKRRKLRVLKRR